jgi:hypothetical protein
LGLFNGTRQDYSSHAVGFKKGRQLLFHNASQTTRRVPHQEPFAIANHDAAVIDVQV